MAEERRTRSISSCLRCRDLASPANRQRRVGDRPHRANLGGADETPGLYQLRRTGWRLGSPVSNAMARQAPTGLLGIHINLPAVVPPEIAAVLAVGGPAPTGLTDKERAAFDALSAAAKMGNRSYATMMGTRPQTIGYAINDFSHRPRGVDARASGLLTLDIRQQRSRKVPGRGAGRHYSVLAEQQRDLSRAAVLGVRWTQRCFAAVERTLDIALPVAITVFPEETYLAPETWARRAYPNLIYFHEVDKGGHFAAWEQPELFSAELRCGVPTAPTRFLRRVPGASPDAFTLNRLNLRRST